MRVPTAQPRRRFRLRGWIIGAVVALLLLLFSLRGLAGFYTDFLWFDSLGQGSTWSSLLAAKVMPALVFTAIFFVLMFANLVIADKLAPKYRSTGPEDELIGRYQAATARYTSWIRVGVAMFFALIFGVGVSSQWKQWVLFINHVDFHIKDPQFNKDIGFYVFQLPFLKFIAEWLFGGLVIVLLVTALAHYLNGGIRFQTPFQRVTPQVKAHLSFILAAMALVKTAQYYLGRFELDFSSRGVVEGASYTDVHAQLPALNLLIFISIVAAILFLWNIHRRGWVLPIIAVGLWAFVSVALGTIYPALIQQFVVGPNEFAKEAPYIDRNIRATRHAFQLDTVETKNFDYTTFGEIPPTDQQAVVESNKGTIDNARLWDPNVLTQTYNTLQQIQTYYQIGDVDVDRYLVDNETRQVLIAARNLNSVDLPSQSFVNRHIVYTHGYGVVASPSNEAATDGSPDFYLSDIPVLDQGIHLSAKTASQVYFGENLSSYVLTGAQSREFNYQTAGKTDQFTRYKGKDGVTLSNWVRRAAFTLKFSDFNLLLSGQIDSGTKILMERDIKARVSKLAPFLKFDGDPYPVVLGNKTVWVLDGYTATSMYPYSQSTSGENGLASDFNYVRNSVKATVDAYQGTVTFYIWDTHDPIIEAWDKAFPDLFTPKSQMPSLLRDHLRYPEDQFKVQANMFGRYHVNEPRRFYDASAKWLVSPDPGSGQVTDLETTIGGSSTASANAAPQAASSSGKRIDPYYLYLKLPDATSEHFIAIEPFVPVSSGNSINRLASFLTANSDRGQYGKLESFEMPQGSSALGPVQVANQINSTSAISQQITLLGRGNSRIIAGSLQLIPVGNSIVYVRPFYVRGTGTGSYPKFQFVAVFTDGAGAVCDQTVNGALDQIFLAAPAPPSCGALSGSSSITPDNNGTTTTTRPSGSTTTTAPPTTGSVQDLLNQAADDFNKAQTALAQRDLATYQSLVNQAQALIEQARQQLAAQK